MSYMELYRKTKFNFLKLVKFKFNKFSFKDLLNILIDLLLLPVFNESLRQKR
jgi:hypothetical protein